MNRALSPLIPFTASLCFALILTCAPAAQATTAAAVSDAECANAEHLTYLQRRIVETASQGIVPLRQFVWRTRMIHQLDLMESVAWLDQRRALLAACEQRSARIDPFPAER